MKAYLNEYYSIVEKEFVDYFIKCCYFYSLTEVEESFLVSVYKEINLTEDSGESSAKYLFVEDEKIREVKLRMENEIIKLELGLKELTDV